MGFFLAFCMLAFVVSETCPRDPPRARSGLCLSLPPRAHAVRTTLAGDPGQRPRIRPELLFGSLLVMICLDLTSEWLVDVRGKLAPAEYAVLLSTFALLVWLGVELGIVAGVALHVVVRRTGFDVGKEEPSADHDF